MNDVARLTSKIIKELYKNDNLFKLLKYDTSDALSKPKLTDSEKSELIKGSKDIKNKRIHKSSFNENTIEDVRSEIRIYKDFIPTKRCLSEVVFYCEIIVHRNIWELENGEERADEIFFELKKTLENTDVSGIGYLNFNHPVKHSYFGKNYNGYTLAISTNIEW